METEEIYDVLMEQFLRAAAKYDPHYVEKLQRVVEEVKRALRQFAGFRSAELNRHLEFDGSRYLRLLCRRGFLFSERKAAEGGTACGPAPGRFPPEESVLQLGRDRPGAAQQEKCVSLLRAVA